MHTYIAFSNSLTSIDAEAVEIGSIVQKPRTNPMNMPTPTTGKPLVPVLIESGSCSESTSHFKATFNNLSFF